MPSVNKVILIGNLTRDPQTKQLPTQSLVTEFGLAMNRKFKSPEGEDREEVCFVDCAAFGRQAEVIQKYCKKGKSLYIEGRLSRFSKIGGEMVPHEAIEQKIIELLGLSGRHERPIAIVGVRDEAKGEALVLLSAVDIDIAELRKKLQEAGVPNLWIPKHLHRVEAIPVLASGKLDLKRCQECAAER